MENPYRSTDILYELILTKLELSASWVNCLVPTSKTLKPPSTFRKAIFVSENINITLPYFKH